MSDPYPLRTQHPNTTVDSVSAGIRSSICGRRHLAAGGLWLAVIVLLLGGCGDEPPAPQSPAVTVTRPIRRAVVPYHEFTGTTRAIESAEIRARVSGILESMEFEASHEVAAGDLLFVIERTPYKAARDEALASLKAAKAELARAESDLVRLQQAVKTKAVSEQDLDRGQAMRDQAEAAVLGAQARLATANLNYEYTLVRSPIDGVASRNFVDPGNLVGVSEPTLLTTVNKMNPIFVYFDAPEALVLGMLQARREESERGGASTDTTGTTGQTFVSLANESGFPHRGEIDYIDNTVDPTTGTIHLRAVVENEDLVIFPGLFVRVRISGRTKDDAVLVDQKAIGTDLGGKFVYLLGENNIVEQRYVMPGQLEEDGMVVIEQGLDGDEQYIVNGVMRARPGLPVTPQQADTTDS